MFGLTGHMGPVLCVSVSPDGTRVATGSTDMTAKVWDCADRLLLLELIGNLREVASVWFSATVCGSSPAATTKRRRCGCRARAGN